MPANGNGHSHQPTSQTLEDIQLPDSMSLADKFAFHLSVCQNPKEAAKRAGYSPNQLRTNFYSDWKNPDSAIRKAVRSFADANCELLALKADATADHFLTGTHDIAKTWATKDYNGKLQDLPRLGNAMEFARKFSSRRDEAAPVTVQHVTYQVAIGAIYQGDSKSKSVSRSPVIDVSHDNVQEDDE